MKIKEKYWCPTCNKFQEVCDRYGGYKCYDEGVHCVDCGFLFDDETYEAVNYQEMRELNCNSREWAK